ncbi:YeeE/YedE family protein [Thiomicrorhabdus sp.]|uniref:YeeE/YedE family protein n=1 Tax=Thiomicrorhabdus sp. TaxID=2039724 RepID=UPI002AA7A95F|nr:YeeE/YedE family protein [Thiomicrorhabdus sp.]
MNRTKFFLYILLLTSPLWVFALNNVMQNSQLFTFNLILIGALLGASLNYFQFGFSSSFRSSITEKRTAGMRSIIWLLAIAILLFAPLLALQAWHEQTFTGFIRPLSLAIPLGAFIFGIGMQIGCGCTSGTLNRVGQLQAMSFSTLLFMIIGGSLAAMTFADWNQLPVFEPFAFQRQFGWALGLLIQLLLLAFLYLLLKRLEQRHHQDYQPLIAKQHFLKTHPFLAAAISLAFLNASLLFISGTPWSISSVFPYWGTSLIDLFGLSIDWTFWDYTMENSTRMNQGLFENTVSLTTIGVILGAFIASLIHPRIKVKISAKALAASMIGGTIMGFGAVMASGCNIGAFFSGIASGSLHGWVWLVFALFGNMLGLMIRKQVFNIKT